MGLFERIMGGSRPDRVTIYHSPTCLDCQEAKRFFSEQGIEMDLRDVSASEEVREEMQRRFGRVATPAIVVGNRVFWGFEDNRGDIADLLGLDAGTSDSTGG